MSISNALDRVGSRQAPDPIGVLPVGADRLRTLIGVPTEIFARDYWGRQPLLSRASELPGTAQSCLDLAAVDSLLSERGLRTPFIRLTREGSMLNNSRFTAPGGAGATINDQVSDTLMTDLLLDGTTVVLQGLHRTWRPVIDLVTELSAELACPVQANAYITPPDSRGFDAHYDVHDVFVIQLAGRKLWQVHAPVHLHPLADQPWTSHRAAVEARAAEAPLLEVTLEPGDVLYLPRGTVHGALTRDDLSAHLTLGVHPVTGHAALTAALALLRDSETLRASLPLGTRLDSPLGGAAVAQALADLTAAVSALAPEDVAAGLAATVLPQTRPAPLAPLAQAALATSLRADTSLRLRSGLQTHLRTRADGGATVTLPQASFDVLPAEFAAVRAVLAGGPVAAAALPGLSPEEALGLLGRLLRLGVVVAA